MPMVASNPILDSAFSADGSASSRLAASAGKSDTSAMTPHFRPAHLTLSWRSGHA